MRRSWPSATWRRTTDLRPFYYGGFGGRSATKALVESRYAKKTPNYQCKVYEDFRVMLEKEKAIDAILCATPDHAHAVITIRAMKMGKHVYCEKPLTHNIWEARQVAAVAKETGVATQMGNQGHSGEGIRQTCEWIWDGAIGPVREVHAWSDVGQWIKTPGRPKETPAAPEGFNWDIWLGPRAQRPYHPSYAPYNWRGWWAFGTGAIGDMACHNLDPAVMALKLASPTSVEATSTGVDDEVTSFGGLYNYRFGPRGDMPALKLTWYDGGLRPPTPEGLDLNDPKQRLGERGNGILFVGDKGLITCAGWAGMPRLLPMSLHREYKRPEKNIAQEQGSSRRLAGRVQGRQAGQRQLRIQRAADGAGLAGQCGHAQPEEDLVGRREHESHQRARSGRISEGTVSQGVGDLRRDSGFVIRDSRVESRGRESRVTNYELRFAFTPSLSSRRKGDPMKPKALDCCRDYSSCL